MFMDTIMINSNDEYKFQMISKFIKGKLSRKETAKLLQCSERTVSRLARRVESRGVFGVKHAALGRSKENCKYPPELKQKIFNLFLKTYFDYNVTHFKEALGQEHGIDIPYKTLWRWFKKVQLVKNPVRRRPKKYTVRARMPQEGLLLQMDGSEHAWNGKDKWSLISVIDDATSSLVHAEFYKSETTLNCLDVLKKVIEKKGIPQAIYTDRAGWSGGQKRVEFSHFQRACEKLGIQLIYAYSPQAKGRIERSYRTIQGRLIPELRRHNIKTLKKANTYLQNVFLKQTWERSMVVEPLEKESAYRSVNPFVDMDLVLCLEERRKINSDHTLAWKGKRFKVLSGPMNFAGFEAVFRTNLKGNTRVFVMEREVRIQEVSLLQPVIKPPVETKASPYHPRFYLYMAPTIIRLRNRLVQHLVTGKPLNLHNLHREVA